MRRGRTSRVDDPRGPGGLSPSVARARRATHRPLMVDRCGWRERTRTPVGAARAAHEAAPAFRVSAHRPDVGVVIIQERELQPAARAPCLRRDLLQPWDDLALWF